MPCIRSLACERVRERNGREDSGYLWSRALLVGRYSHHRGAVTVAWSVLEGSVERTHPYNKMKSIIKIKKSVSA